MDVSYDDMEARALKFCNAIDATLTYINGEKFTIKLKSGETDSIYWWELGKLMHDLGIKESKMTELKRRREESAKIRGRGWEKFLDNLADAGYSFNDHYYDKPHQFIDAFDEDGVYEIEVTEYRDCGYKDYEVIGIHRIPDEEVMPESQKFGDQLESLMEAQRFTHRIVLLPKDTKYSFKKSFSDQLRFYSAEEAEKKKAELEAGSFGTKLKKLGLSLGIEEIEKKPRHTGTEDSDYENPFEIGDILFGDVGYSMSIPEWWQVIKKTDKSVTCRRLATDIVEHDGYGQRGTEVPIRGVFDKRGGTVNGKPSDAPVTMRVKKWTGQVAGWRGEGKDQYYASLGGSRYGHIFSLWDGKPKDFDYYD